MEREKREENRSGKIQEEMILFNIHRSTPPTPHTHTHAYTHTLSYCDPDFVVCQVNKPSLFVTRSVTTTISSTLTGCHGSAWQPHSLASETVTHTHTHTHTRSRAYSV